eukprot:6325214-Ditylum_brightwellii.AAC.1
MMNLFECEELGEVNEYVGRKIDYDWKYRSILITQPVLFQSYKDEFNLDEHGKVPKTPAEAGSVPRKGKGEPLNTAGHKKYHTGVGKLQHMNRWPHPDIQNSVRECSKMVSFPTKHTPEGNA